MGGPGEWHKSSTEMPRALHEERWPGRLGERVAHQLISKSPGELLKNANAWNQSNQKESDLISWVPSVRIFFASFSDEPNVRVVLRAMSLIF